MGLPEFSQGGKTDATTTGAAEMDTPNVNTVKDPPAFIERSLLGRTVRATEGPIFFISLVAPCQSHRLNCPIHSTISPKICLVLP